MQPHDTWLGGALAVALILFVIWLIWCAHER